MPFDELGLSAPVLKAVADAGYSQPTPIQHHAIPYVLQGRDVLGCAQTGTGKTASFTLPMIDILSQGRARARMARSLILEPTRELATQVAENFQVYGKYHKLSMALLIGGVSFDDQKGGLDRGADVLIATPGRLLDHFERGGLLLRGVEILVIDEADRMLDMGFIPDVERIVQLTNPKRQTLFFSATMPPEIRRLADLFLNDPEEIAVAPPASPAETVDQSLVPVQERDKRAALRFLLREQPVKNALVFCNRKRDVDIVHRSLVKHGFNAAALHGDLSQSHRTQTLEKFRAGEITVLVCSDVAARGLDIQGLSHVMLFDVPIHAEDYVHRIGRTGRAGMPGRSFTLVSPADGKFLAAVQKLIAKDIPTFELDGFEPADVDEDDEPRRRRGRRSAADGGKPEGARERAPRRSRASSDKAAAPRARTRTKSGDDEPAPRARTRGKSGDDDPAPRERSRTRSGDDAPAPKSPRKKPEARTEKPEKPVVGMGDHVPAFMLRPAAPKK